MPITNGQPSNGGSGGGGSDIATIFLGTYDATTNTIISTGQHLVNGVGDQGDWVLVKIPGNNTPAGAVVANQLIIYNGSVWEAGAQINDTNEMVIANGYIVIRGQTIQVGQQLTVSLGILEGEIVDLSQAIATALNTKANLVANPTNGDILTTNALGQPVDSGTKLSDVTNQINTNTNNIANLNQTKQSTVPSAVNGNIAQFNNGSTVDSNVSVDTIAQQGQQINQNAGAISDLQQTVASQNAEIVTLQNEMATTMQLVPIAVNGNIAKFGANGQVIDTGIPIGNMTAQGNVFNTANKLVQTDANNALVNAIILSNAYVDVNGQAQYKGTLSAVLTNILAAIPAPYVPTIATATTTGVAKYPLSGALSIAPDGSVTVAVDGVTIQIVNGKLVAIGSAPVSGIVNIHTPDNKNNTTSTINLLNGAGIDIRSDANGNITITNTGSGSETKFYNTLCVSPLGNDTSGDGSLTNPYLTITKALSVATAGYALWLEPGTYAGFTWTPNIPIYGMIASKVTISGQVTVNATGTYEGANFNILNAAGVGLAVSGASTVIPNFILNNMSITGSTYAMSFTGGVKVKGYLQQGYISLTAPAVSGKYCIYADASSPSGSTFSLFYVTVVNGATPNYDYPSIAVGGAFALNHTFDNLYGQAVVTGTATYNPTLVKLTTATVPAITTSSATVSIVSACITTTSSQYVITGSGGLGIASLVYAGTGTELPNTLNGGQGAIVAPSAAIRLDPSASLITLIQSGMIQTDSANIYVDLGTTRYKLPTADLTSGKLISTWLNYNQTPTNANKSTTDVMSSASFFAAMATIPGSNLTWDAVNGVLNANTTPGGSKASAQYSNFSSNIAISTGKINVSTASATDIDGLTPATTAEIPLLPNQVFNVTAVLNVNCANQPESNVTNLSYSGTVDNPPAYALSTANCTSSYGAIANGVFTSTAGANNFGSLATNNYNNTYSIVGYTVTVKFTAIPYIVGKTSSITGNVYLYSQIGNNSPQWLLAKISNVVTDIQLPYISRSGGASGSNQGTFTQPATGSTTNSTVAMGVDNLAMAWDGSTTVNNVAYSNNAMASTPTWNQSTGGLTTPITNTTWLLQAIGDDGSNPIAIIIDQVSGVTGVLDFASGFFRNGSQFPLTNGQPISLNFGGFGANHAYVATLSASPVIVYTTSDQSGWFNIDLSTKGIVGNVNGIAYNPITNRWVCSAWDGTTNRFYYSNSPTLTSATWTQANGTANQALTRIVGGYTAGGGYAFATGCISLNTNVYTTIDDINWSIPSSVPAYSAGILPYYIGGMFVLAPNFSSNPFVLISNDGLNFVKINTQTDPYRCGGIGGNLIIPGNTSATYTSISYAYVFDASGFGNNIPQAAWTGNQEIVAGVGATSGSVSRTVLAINNYLQTGNNSFTATSVPRIGIPGGNMWFGATMLGMCGGETITSIAAQLSYVGNTFVASLVGTNATLPASVPQTPGQQGVQQIVLSAKCHAGATNPSVAIQVTYADGTNTLLPNSTIEVIQI